jgi:epsilon-lactone hydrolase
MVDDEGRQGGDRFLRAGQIPFGSVRGLHGEGGGAMDVVRAMYERWARGTGLDDDSWGDLTIEPRGVDYLEVDAGGTPAMWANPHEAADDRVILAVHGGGFVGGSLYTHRKLFGHVAKAAGVRALLVDYRLAPKFVFPAQLDDVVAAYRWVLGQGFAPGHVALCGDSSGGGLAVTAMLRARELGLPLAAALLLMSPWVDMELTGETHESNAGKDIFFTRQLVQGLVDTYLGGGADPRDPLVNALYADLGGLPPMYLQVGADEALVSDSRMLAARAREAGVEARLDEFAGQVHTFQMAAGRTPDADEGIRRFAAWLRPKLRL